VSKRTLSPTHLHSQHLAVIVSQPRAHWATLAPSGHQLFARRPAARRRYASAIAVVVPGENVLISCTCPHRCLHRPKTVSIKPGISTRPTRPQAPANAGHGLSSETASSLRHNSVCQRNRDSHPNPYPTPHLAGTRTFISHRYTLPECLLSYWDRRFLRATECCRSHPPSGTATRSFCAATRHVHRSEAVRSRLIQLAYYVSSCGLKSY